MHNEAGTMNSKDTLHTISSSYIINRKPMLHALIVGINTFKNTKLQLNYAVEDAQLFADTLKKQSVGLFDTVNIQLVNTSEQSSKRMMMSHLTSFQSLNPNDLFVFYVASQGAVDDGEYFLITSQPANYDRMRLLNRSLKTS